MTAMPYETPSLIPTDAAMWAAVLDHDAAADGTFLYGVMTTGVYCRPSCPSRRPLKANVRFFADRAAAEAAGLRACRRCHPNDASIAERHAVAVAKACALIADSEELPGLDALANAAGGLAWASLFAGGAYYFGERVREFERPIAFALLTIALVLVSIFFAAIKRYEKKLAQAAADQKRRETPRDSASSGA